MSATAVSHPGQIDTHRGWTIIQNNDGIICLDPRGSNCMPGACSHANVKDAKKSIDHYIMANGNAHLFWLLWGQFGHDTYAFHTSVMETSGDFTIRCGKRDNTKYEPTYEYEHKVSFNKAENKLSLRTAPAELLDMSPESALQLSNLLRSAALQALGKI